MTQSRNHTAAETALPNLSEKPERAKSERMTPTQPNKSKAKSLGNQKKMLGDSVKLTCCDESRDGQKPVLS